VADPLVESATDLAAAAEAELQKMFHLRGITLADVEIVGAMDEGDVPQVLPPLYQRSGELKKTAKALSMPQLRALMLHARETASSLAERLFSGETTIAPLRDSSRTSCDMCDFRTVCRFDASAPGARLRELPGMDMEEMRCRLDENAVKEQE
jgi:ATP-dependent helicase/nuclease subunit B